MSDVINCEFSLLKEERKYSGQHRKYVIENAREICYAPETRERIKLREALGYYGHGRRILSQKMDLQEVEIITLPDGQQAMVSNVPSNLTISFDVDVDGTVKHSQELLNTETGKIVAGLNASRVGGFSWACPGKDGRSKGVTILTGFSGFDYVLQPGFSKNRGYILESAFAPALLESVAAIVGDDKKAEQLVTGWKLSDVKNYEDLEEQIFESEQRYVAIKEQYDNVQKECASLITENAQNKEKLLKSKNDFRTILVDIAAYLPFFIPESAMADMLNGDFSRARVIFENASKTDYSQFPLHESQKNFNKMQPTAKISMHRDYSFGSTEYGFVTKF